MIITPYGMCVKNVVHLDEQRQLVTVQGFTGTIATYAIKAVKADGGIDEIRRKYSDYVTALNAAGAGS